MTPGQSLSQLTSKLLVQLESQFKKSKPDLILAHGDTTTCFATAISSFYHQIPFFHVEAGLRTNRLNSPFPEEFNRQSIAPIAHHHFAPTMNEKENLLRDGIDETAITVTGSTVHEALHTMKTKSVAADFPMNEKSKKIVVVTLHRRESNQMLESTLHGLKQAALHKDDTLFICPIHPNPNVQRTFRSTLRGLSNVVLLPPLAYPQFISLLLNASLVVTDSGGVQEEAAFLGKRVLLARQETERHDGIHSGLVKLVGLSPDAIASTIITDLNDSHQSSNDLSDFVPATSASELIAREVLKVV